MGYEEEEEEQEEEEEDGGGGGDALSRMFVLLDLHQRPLAMTGCS